MLHVYPSTFSRPDLFVAVFPEMHLLLQIYALSVSLPSCQSKELAFDQAYKAPRKWCILDPDCRVSGGGGRMASFEGKRLLGREVKVAGGDKEFAKISIFLGLLEYTTNGRDLKFRGGKGKKWDWCAAEFETLVLRPRPVCFSLLLLTACLHHNLCLCFCRCFLVPVVLVVLPRNLSA